MSETKDWKPGDKCLSGQTLVTVKTSFTARNGLVNVVVEGDRGAAYFAHPDNLRPLPAPADFRWAFNSRNNLDGLRKCFNPRLVDSQVYSSHLLEEIRDVLDFEEATDHAD
jgi:hypothetical protein